jgi:hypothetical protein
LKDRPSLDHWRPSEVRLYPPETPIIFKTKEETRDSTTPHQLGQQRPENTETPQSARFERVRIRSTATVPNITNSHQVHSDMPNLLRSLIASPGKVILSNRRKPAASSLQQVNEDANTHLPHSNFPTMTDHPGDDVPVNLRVSPPLMTNMLLSGPVDSPSKHDHTTFETANLPSGLDTGDYREYLVRG